MHFYIALIMIFSQGQYNAAKDPNVNVILYYINAPIDGYSQIIVQGVMMVFFLFIAVGYLIAAKNTYNQGTVNSVPNLKRALNITFTGIMSFSRLPVLELFIGSYFVSSDSTTVSQQILLQVMTAINAVFFVVLIYVLQKLFICKIPHEMIHWSASSTQLHFMKAFNKVLLVVCHMYISTEGTGGNYLYLSIPLLIMFAGTGYFRIMLIPHYQPGTEWITRGREIITACLMLILVWAQLAATPNDGLALGLLIGVVSIPCTLALSIVVDVWRQKQLWSNLE